MSPRSQEQFKEIRDRSREAIIESALELFTQRGYHGTSVSMIADRAGISTGLMYNYFRSKLELLEAIIVKGIKIIEISMEDIGKIKDPNRRIEILIEGMFQMAIEDEQFWNLYFNVLMLPNIPNDAKRIFTDFIIQMFDAFENLFRQLEFPHPKAESRIFAGIIDGVLLHYMVAKGNYPLDEVRELLLQKYTGKRG